MKRRGRGRGRSGGGGGRGAGGGGSRGAGGRGGGRGRSSAAKGNKPKQRKRKRHRVGGSGHAGSADTVNTDVLAALAEQRRALAAEATTTATTPAPSAPPAPPSLPGYTYDPVTNRHWPVGSEPGSGAGAGAGAGHPPPPPPPPPPPVPAPPRAHASHYNPQLSVSAALLARQTGAVSSRLRLQSAVLRHAASRLSPASVWMPETGSSVTSIASDPHGRCLIAAGQTLSLIPLPPSEHHRITLTPYNASRAIKVQMSPHCHDKLAVGYADSVFINSTVDHDVLGSPSHRVTELWDLSWAPFADWIACGCSGTASGRFHENVVLDVSRHATLYTWKAKSDTLSVSWSTDCEVQLFCGQRSGGVVSVDLRQPRPTPLLKLKAGVKAVRGLSRAHEILVADCASTLGVYDTRFASTETALVRTLDGYSSTHKREPLTCDLGGSVVAAVLPGYDTVRLWDVSSGAHLADRSGFGSPGTPVTCVAVASTIPGMGPSPSYEGGAHRPFQCSLGGGTVLTVAGGTLAGSVVVATSCDDEDAHA